MFGRSISDSGSRVTHCLNDISNGTAQESLEPVISHQVVLDTEIDKWLKSPPCTCNADLRTSEPTPDPKELSLRLIALEDPKRVDSEAWKGGPLVVKRAIYDNIVSRFEISPLFLTVALNKDAVHFKVSIALTTNTGSDSFELEPSTA